tara:strand:- start:1762 stop:5418 length:3657 start_codon:yes stop_codon:yes gene_type:complete
MSSAKRTTQPTEKAYPNVKTIILKENDPGVISEDGRPGIWKKNLNEDITLKDGDSVLVKEAFIDTRTDGGGLITITPDIIDQLAITTGCYWQDSGSGIPVERYKRTATGEITEGIGYVDGGPEPLLSQVRLSEDPAETPNGKNYILQNSFPDFSNTRFYLNTDTVNQDGAGLQDYSAFKGNVTTAGTNYDANANTNIELIRTVQPPALTQARCTYLVEPVAGGSFGVSDVIITDGGLGYLAPRPNNIANPPMPIPDVLEIGVPPAANNGRFTLTQVNIPLTLELVPNPGYNPTTDTHEYYDYRFAVVLPTGEPQPTWALPQPNGNPPTNTIYPLFKTTDLVGLRLASDPNNPNKLKLYPHSYSGDDVILTNPPPVNGHIATIISEINAENNAEWKVVKNDDWDKTDAPTLTNPYPAPGQTNPAQGWVFTPQVNGPAGQVDNVSFNTADQPGLYRICTGFWAWIWSNSPDPTSSELDPTYPAQFDAGSSLITNWYNLTLEYYAPGNSAGGGAGANRTHKVTTSHEWNPAVPDKDPRMDKDFYQPQFPKYVDSNKAGVGSNTPDSDGFLSPESQFPTPPNPTNSKDSRYPSTGGKQGGTFMPVWFSAMEDTSSTPPINGQRRKRTFDPFIYNNNPALELGTTDSDAINFQPFRLSASGSFWGGSPKRHGMESWQQCGFIQQDNRGAIEWDGTKFQEAGIPPIWKDLKGTTMTKAPEFRMTNACVLSRPYIPTGSLHMTPRVFTTKLKDIPGNNLPVLSNGNSVTYTYSAWARLLTDTLNKIQTPIGRLSNQPSLPANPDPPNFVPGTFPLNNATYTASRILTDTVQLGYQGKDSPSNRFGVGWGRADGLGPVATYPFKATSGKPSGYLPSEQPYWISEDGKSAFAYKDGVPLAFQSGTALTGNPVDYATVDPLGATLQAASVFGQNGAKWVGAESLSIIFNDESSAFEIVQMHSNLYSASSGAVITKEFRSGTKGLAYPGGIQNLTIADQSSGVFITDWQPESLWTGLMNMSPNTKVHNGGAFINTAMNFNSFATEVGFESVNALAIDLKRGLNITGNFKSNTGLIDKRVNIIGAPPDTATDPDPKLIGGNYDSPVIPFNLQSETNVPVTILGSTIIQTETADPFFMIELKGMNSNSIYGMQRENALISSIVGRYYVAGSYTIGDSQGAIEYVHRGEPMTIRQLGIRILNSAGKELAASQIKNTSAIIIQINGQDISIVD